MSKFRRIHGVSLLVMALSLTACQRGQPGAKAEPSADDRQIAEYSESIRVDPNKPFDRGQLAYALRGAAYDRKGEHEKAVVDYTEAIRLYAANKAPFFEVRLREAHEARGRAYQSMKDYDRAIADFTSSMDGLPRASSDIGEALMLGGWHASALYKRGLCYEAKGDPAKAQRDFEAAAKADPNFVNANEDLKKRLKK